ncbi:hypothetical protein DPMN_080002 [Dreissena polymorpha]|uniref:Uncharacterized protein n=1 Tax=Dreissena polymorpha TaxID=45954 RepID=A0A9D4BIU8_DREPO|nr:hypothetical protein DPMN_080002 [Dreissena polymorpha]
MAKSWLHCLHLTPPTHWMRISALMTSPAQPPVLLSNVLMNGESLKEVQSAAVVYFHWEI